MQSDIRKLDPFQKQAKVDLRDVSLTLRGTSFWQPDKVIENPAKERLRAALQNLRSLLDS